MKEGEGKAVRKSNEITGTPAHPITAAVTPKASEREQEILKSRDKLGNSNWRNISVRGHE
jgi:hypothetical protein